MEIINEKEAQERIRDRIRKYLEQVGIYRELEDIDFIYTEQKATRAR